ncbi:Elongation of very long chain fatty acids protein [Danaus plexippus plexippus]|uniref:Elongation of very long chain fatty acids protein n=2 Tax=Danaus plexippus TaxID=13037 RepID=A0A212FP96_DANPL|nr:Elongation of very long chain fatty acids protein [Danaus plexippus plexippus]
MSKYLWWKKYITRMQLIQFVFIISHAAASTFLERCPPSNTLKFVIIMNASLFIYLFGKFYVNAYLKSKTVNLKNNEITTPNSKNIKVN